MNSTLLADAIGGPARLLDTGLPAVVFVIVNAASSLTPAIFAAARLRRPAASRSAGPPPAAAAGHSPASSASASPPSSPRRTAQRQRLLPARDPLPGRADDRRRSSRWSSAGPTSATSWPRSTPGTRTGVEEPRLLRAMDQRDAHLGLRLPVPRRRPGPALPGRPSGLARRREDRDGLAAVRRRARRHVLRSPAARPHPPSRQQPSRRQRAGDAAVR